MPKLNFNNAPPPSDDFHGIPQVIETDIDQIETFMNLDQADHLHLPMEKIYKREGSISVEPDRINQRHILVNGS